MNKNKLKNLKKYFPPNMLEMIAEVETSGGKNFKHKTVETGIQAGDHAIGNFGLMPNTIATIVNRNPNDPDFQVLRKYLDVNNVPIDKVGLEKHIMDDPSLERKLAGNELQKIEKRVGGNPLLGAVAWTAGGNLTPNRIQDILKQKSNRGRDARNYYNKFKRVQKILPQNLGMHVPELVEDYTYQKQPEIQTPVVQQPIELPRELFGLESDAQLQPELPDPSMNQTSIDLDEFPTLKRKKLL